MNEKNSAPSNSPNSLGANGITLNKDTNLFDFDYTDFSLVKQQSEVIENNSIAKQVVPIFESLKNKYNFSFYKGGIKSISPSESNFTLQRLYSAVRSSNYVDKVKAIRAGDKSIKSTLDYVTAAGTFTTRSNANLIERSGVFSIDFDHVTDLRVLKADLIVKLTPALFFESPSGHGLKVFYFIDVNVGSHSDYFKAFQNHFRSVMNIEIDKQCSDVARACYLSWDCNSYLNENSQILGKDFLDKYLPEEITEIQPPQQPKPAIVQTSENKISDFEQCEIIKKNIDKTESFVTGNRNHYCGLLCAGLNRIGIDNNTAYNFLEQFEQPDFTASEIQKIVECSYKQTNLHGCNPITISKPENNLNVSSKRKNHYNGEANEFPVNVFPTPFRELIEETKASLNYPVDYTGSAILCAISTAIGKTAVLQVKKAWKEYAPLYLGIVGNAGAAKSHPLEMCFQQLERIDKENLKEYELLFNAYIRYNDLPKKEKALEPQVEKPTLIKSILGNFSAEILCQRLADNKRGNCVKSEELETWLQGMNNYSKGDQASTYLSFWSCKGTSVDRVSKPIPLFVECPYLNIIGSIQPRRIKSLFPSDKCDSGFLPRFLWAFPLNADKEKVSDREMNLERLENYNNWITNYISHYTPTIDNWGNPAPKIYTWSPDAKDCWFNFQHTNSEKCKAAGESLWSEVLNKFDIHFVRLSLLLQIMINPLSDTISLQACEGATKLCKYFETCSKMILDRLEVESNTLTSATVAKYLVENCGHSQNKAAEIIGVSQPYVNKVLKKK